MSSGPGNTTNRMEVDLLFYFIRTTLVASVTSFYYKEIVAVRFSFVVPTLTLTVSTVIFPGCSM